MSYCWTLAEAVGRIPVHDLSRWQLGLLPSMVARIQELESQGKQVEAACPFLTSSQKSYITSAILCGL